MDFHHFTNILVDNGINTTIKKAQAIYSYIGVIVSERDHFKEEADLWFKERQSILDKFIAANEEIARLKGELSRQQGDKLSSKTNHEVLVNYALNNDEVLGHLKNGKKIDAIKALRNIGWCSLIEAKNAIEDYRLLEYHNQTI